MPEVVKNLGSTLKLFDTHRQGFGGLQEDTAQHSLLGLDGVRRESIDFPRSRQVSGITIPCPTAGFTLLRHSTTFCGIDHFWIMN
jgi:hypothetical protein